MTTDPVIKISCRCGQVSLEVSDEPIVTTVCHCSSCRKAGEILQQLQGSERILASDGATPFVLFRKDRVRCVQGASLLAEYRLRPESPTRRVVATCCGSAMFLDFTKGHWISVYGNRLSSELQATKSGYFIPRLILAWVKMGFRIPKIDYVAHRLSEPTQSGA
jgi:hypothetical protein